MVTWINGHYQALVNKCLGFQRGCNVQDEICMAWKGMEFASDVLVCREREIYICIAWCATIGREGMEYALVIYVYHDPLLRMREDGMCKLFQTYQKKLFQTKNKMKYKFNFKF